MTIWASRVPSPPCTTRLDVLGLDPLAPEWGGEMRDEGSRQALDALVRARVAEREHARQARDFATADAIRDELAGVGIVLADSPAGTTWSLVEEDR